MHCTDYRINPGSNEEFFRLTKEIVMNAGIYTHLSALRYFIAPDSFILRPPPSGKLHCPWAKWQLFQSPPQGASLTLAGGQDEEKCANKDRSLFVKFNYL